MALAFQLRIRQREDGTVTATAERDGETYEGQGPDLYGAFEELAASLEDDNAITDALDDGEDDE